MAAYFGLKKELKQYNGIPPHGNFALEPIDSTKLFHWDHCREQFAAKFVDALGFYFSHPEHKGRDVANFLSKFEQIVGIHPVSSFAETNKNVVLWVNVSPFWISCWLKRSLLTILLRCGINYNSDQDNFDDALFGNYKENIYVRETKSAVLRFMFGFTKFVGKNPINVFQSSIVKHGWREEFQKLDDSVIRRRLILPEGCSKETNMVGLESLWT